MDLARSQEAILSGHKDLKNIGDVKCLFCLFALLMALFCDIVL